MGITLRLLLGDQLNHQHSWFQESDDQVLYLMMEMQQETDYVKHHIQKVTGFFTAMRAFSEEMTVAGHRFLYLSILNPRNQQSISANLEWILEEHEVSSFEYQLPDEYRLDQLMAEIVQGLPVPAKAVDTEHFLTSRTDLATLFKGKKTYLMETFYRKMRKEFGIMLEPDGSPVGGKWNYDAQNRNRYDGKVSPPPTDQTITDTSPVYADIQEAGIETIGKVNPDQYIWPVTRTQALEMLEDFVENRLPWFGTYQDSLDNDEWALFHSRISFPLNVKLLHPLEVVDKAVEAWKASPERISLPQIEGFVRQIIGWREFMRGVYWAHMPEYATLNYFNHTRKLPEWFWTGETKMKCLSTAIHNSLDYAYAHHIQRLMVTGNFALLAGIHPDEIDEWYLGIYIDAIEWVEITNTRGMSQYADGGIVGTKPYVASANYMNKMSNHCKVCYYKPKLRHGEGACPFNSLYWHFYARHEESLRRNPRIGFAYRNLAKMSQDEHTQTMAQAEEYLRNLDSL